MTNLSPSRPKFRIVYKGIDISSEIAPHLIACTYTDKVHGEADEIEVEVQDKDGLWRGGWCPEHGDVVSLAIGYEPGPLAPCGDFEIDEPNARLGRDGDTFSFRGLSAPVSKSLRTRKTKGYERQSLKDVAGKIAGDHGLSIVGAPPDVFFERLTQRRERDLEFLSRLADQFGAYFSVRGRQLVFARRSEVHERAPVYTLAAESGDYVSADLKKASHKTYSKSKLSYFDGNTKKKIEVEVEDKAVRNGDTLRIDDRVENEGQARSRAKSELEKENLKKRTGNIVLVGDPLLVAGQIVRFDAGFGAWAGRYVVKTSRHRIARAGYTTNIEINGVGDE
ncbi:MAG: late control protein D [Rhizobiales bacterium]|nr:late control protein D [Hyphomicrobiales bacterium]